MDISSVRLSQIADRLEYKYGESREPGESSGARILSALEKGAGTNGSNGDFGARIVTALTKITNYPEPVPGPVEEDEMVEVANIYINVTDIMDKATNAEVGMNEVINECANQIPAFLSNVLNMPVSDLKKSSVTGYMHGRVDMDEGGQVFSASIVSGVQGVPISMVDNAVGIGVSTGGGDNTKDADFLFQFAPDNSNQLVIDNSKGAIMNSYIGVAAMETAKNSNTPVIIEASAYTLGNTGSGMTVRESLGWSDYSIKFGN